MSGKGRAARNSAASRTERAAERLFELNEFELNLVVAINAFNRWVARCASAPGLKGFSTFDALVLNCLSRLHSRRSLADICSIAHLQEKASGRRKAFFSSAPPAGSCAAAAALPARC
jgi:predicted MarR family transcription regulator